MNTRKFPCTMAEAFGPYTSHRLESINASNERSQIWATRFYAVMLVAAIAATIIVGARS